MTSIDPPVSHKLAFDLNRSGSTEKPQDIRSITESQVDPETGDSVQDVFSIICRAVRSPDGVKITIPRLLNLFRAGSYKSRLEVVLENQQPEATMIIELVKDVRSTVKTTPFEEKATPVDKTWRNTGFSGFKNPFKDSIDTVKKDHLPKQTP